MEAVKRSVVVRLWGDQGVVVVGRMNRKNTEDFMAVKILHMIP